MKEKVIVTGGCGFIGSHLVDRLVEDGFEVNVIDDESADNEVFYRNPDAEYWRNNICRFDKYDIPDKIFKDTKCIFHLAAESRIGPAIKDPVRAVTTNVVGTTVMLDIAKKFNIPKFVYSSTSSVYGLNPPPIIDEQVAIDCLNPYSASKYAGEEMVRMYSKMYGIETVILRYFNVYGERSPAKGQYAPVIGIFLKQHAAKKPLTVVGTGEQRRDFVYVKDVVDANIKAMIISTNLYRYMPSKNVFNIGSGENYSVNDIASFISPKVKYVVEREGEMKSTLADIHRSITYLGYNPRMNVRDWIASKLK